MTPAIPKALETLRSRHLFTLHIIAGRLDIPGGPPGMERRISAISGGIFKGERLSGAVLPGGSDWQLVRADGAIMMETGIILETSDNALIAMKYTGLRHGPPDILAQLARGEPVDPSAYYMRIAASFATAAPGYEWMNSIVAIGVGHRPPEGPLYNVFEIV